MRSRRVTTDAVRSPRCDDSMSCVTGSDVPSSVSVKLRPTSSLSGSLGQRGQSAIGPQHGVARTDHGDPLGQRVEGRLPLVLAPADDLVESAVGQHHRGVGGDGGEQPQVLGRERAARRSATASAPMVTPCERSGATAAERTMVPPMRFTVGTFTPWATSIRSRCIAKRTSAVSRILGDLPDERLERARRPGDAQESPRSSSASTTIAPSAWRKRPAYLATWSTMRSSWMDSERT